MTATMQPLFLWLVRYDLPLQLIGGVVCLAAFFTGAWIGAPIRTFLAVASTLVLATACYAKITAGKLPADRRRIEQICLPIYILFAAGIAWLGVDYF